MSANYQNENMLSNAPVKLTHQQLCAKIINWISENYGIHNVELYNWRQGSWIGPPRSLFIHLIKKVTDLDVKAQYELYYEFCITELGHTPRNKQKTKNFVAYYNRTRGYIPTARERAWSKLREAGYLS